MVWGLESVVLTSKGWQLPVWSESLRPEARAPAESGSRCSQARATRQLPGPLPGTCSVTQDSQAGGRAANALPRDWTPTDMGGSGQGQSGGLASSRFDFWCGHSWAASLGGVLQPGPSCHLLGERVLRAFSSSFPKLRTFWVPCNSLLFNQYRPTWRYWELVSR